MVAVRLADDDRGRVPFALLGILLLVASATFSGALSTHNPVADRRVDEAVETVTAETNTAVRAAVRDAAREAAANPVTKRSNTTVGRLLSANNTFRDYLRLRIALAASEHLQTTAVQRGGVCATASLPSTPNESALRAALDRVAIEERENGTLLVVTVENVSVDAWRDGRHVVDDTITTTVGVQTPVLALHDRTERFEHRLDAGITDGGTMDATVTTALWASAWTRGWGQYAGAPIDNVVTNDHAALAANAGVLLAEKQAFGATDRDATGALGRAAVKTGARDLLTLTGSPAAPKLANALPEPNPSESSDTPKPTDPENRSINSSVGPAADHALVALLDGDGRGSENGDHAESFDSVVTDAYRADAAVVAERTVEQTTTPMTQPGDGWELVGTETESNTTVTSLPTRTPDTHVETVVVDSASRLVTTTETSTRTWRRGNETLSSQARSTTETRVDLAVVVDPQSVPGPDQNISPALSRGGALNGANYESAADVATDTLETSGGFDGLARDVAASDEPTPDSIAVTRPSKLDTWLRGDLLDLHQRVRNRTVTVSAQSLAASESNPAAELAADIRADKDELLDAPTTYDGVADRARVAVRAAYLDHVLAELDRRANRTADATGAADDASQDSNVGSLSAAVAAKRAAGDTLGSANATQSADGVRYVPDADPMYLSLDGQAGSSLPAVDSSGTYHPLVARNTNLFTLPYGDATDTVLEPVFGARRRVPLRVAARTLLAADATLDASNASNESLEKRHDRLETRHTRLEAAVTRAMRPPTTAAATTLTEHTDLSNTERRRVLRTALGRWESPAHRALAVTNGSAARAIAIEAAGAGTTEADLLELRLDEAFRAARKQTGATVPQRLTNRTVHTTRSVREDAVATVATDAAMSATEKAVSKRVNKTLSSRLGKNFRRVPAGFPVAPVPGYWYATVNVWDVELAGEFAQFRVHARGDTESLTYARDGASVALDWDGDGTSEAVGRGERVNFTVETAIVVAVPPSGIGVGDIDGNADERSAGWAGGPGCTAVGDCRQS
ncbi:hypothetical protein C453_05914 [Haloferax elongans ATCC BAA-1513]|uniref:Uncharacterized protein n=1 Tax=Haloferax elongans ATCC BAA-1513 TaxID=1230453 RepID=M0HPY7_HALEO|nr:hypothetical protein [Haloferax elongans]ELZ86650.1 hypothetical protein C453_05914 [Haloferax elongans ATCC BAA-1513]